MIVTFGKELPVAKTGDLAGIITAIVDRVSVDLYRLTWEHDSPIGNLYTSITWAKGRRVRFTIETRDAWKHGSRTSQSGRHMRKASWEAHRDIMRAIFVYDSQATIKTALATYRGAKDFEAKFPATGDKNVGSIMYPCTMRECSI
jgi:hypothetical protein